MPLVNLEIHCLPFQNIFVHAIPCFFSIVRFFLLSRLGVSPILKSQDRSLKLFHIQFSQPLLLGQHQLLMLLHRSNRGERGGNHILHLAKGC